MAKKTTYRVLLGSVILLGLGVCANALINPNFTPIHLVEQSEVIAEIRFDFPIKDHKLTGNVNALKGKTKDKTLEFDFSTGATDQIPYVEKVVTAAGEAPAMLFIGKSQEERDKILEEAESEYEEVQDGFTDNEVDDPKVLLHVGGKWLIFYQSKEGVWEFYKIDSAETSLLATWAGATEMLNKCVRYILRDSYAEVPVTSGVKWGMLENPGEIQGKAHDIMLVEIRPGKPYLYVAAEKGDRLYFGEDDESLKDVTGKHKLEAASVVSAWGDLNGDTLIDLLSWDGKALSLHTQGKNGTFKKNPVDGLDLEKDGCIGLTIIDAGEPGESGKPGVLVNTGKVPILWTPDDNKNRKIVDKEFAGKDLGKPGLCLIADMDNDSMPDVMQLMEKGSLLYKGRKPGQFEDPQACNVYLGEGRSTAYLGDFDHDGLFDIFTLHEMGKELWNNKGDGKFNMSVYLAGEVAYIGQPGGIDGMTGDINNDGRQDILIAYSHQAPHIFFNRGFRSFGHGHMIDLAENNILESSFEGQQAACLGDFNNDGGQDMALITKGGEVWVIYRDTGNYPHLATIAALPVGSGFAGPVKVTAWNNDRCLGAWNVMAGTRRAFLGQLDAGPCKVQWTLPGGKKGEKEVIVEDGVVYLEIKP